MTYSGSSGYALKREPEGSSCLNSQKLGDRLIMQASVSDALDAANDFLGISISVSKLSMEEVVS